MNTIKFSFFALVIALTTACASYGIQSFTNFDAALADAKTSLAIAKSAGYEWRDTEKLIAKAESLNTEGKREEALMTLAKAKEQAMFAAAQEKLQESTTGPR